MTFTELANEWLTHKGHLDETSRIRYEHAIASMAPHLHRLPDSRKMPGFCAEIAAWETKRRNELAPSSFNLELATLKSILSHGVVSGYIERNPASAYKPSKRARQEKPVPTPEQFAALIAALRKDGGDDAADFAEFLAYSGCREGEARLLQWRDVDWERNRLLVGRGGNTKNGHEYWLPLFRKLYLLLTALRGKQATALPDDLIFGGMLLRYRLDKACRELGFPRYSHHTFRHYFAVQAIKTLGIAKVAVIAKFLNHQDGGRLILELYGNHVTEDEAAECAARL